MASSSTNPIHEVTFGIELEMLVPYLLSDQPDPAEGMDARQVIRLSEEGIDPEDVSATPKNRVGGILREFLRSHGFNIWESDGQGYIPPTGWSIGSDSTVCEFLFTHYSWVGIEIRSPALSANDTSFTEIKRVVSLLRSSFRLRVNDTTGFHVHVGLGTQQLPSGAVMRLTQLLWCADGILSQLHPPERVLGSYCPSIRYESYLARRELDHWRWMENSTVGGGEAITPVFPSTALTDRLAALKEAPDSLPALDARPDTSRLQRLPPVRTNPFEDEWARRRHRIISGEEWEHDDFRLMQEFSPGMAEQTLMPVLGGLRALCQPEMYAKAARAVEQLSNYCGDRSNYNCTAYAFWGVDATARRMTVEFREAAGSLNPAWVAVWARIASRIVGFCLEAEEDKFVEVIMRILEAELAFEANGGVSRYDVVDLLNDIGLPEEAKFVEENILMGDRALFWFPCVLGENHEDDHPGATVMVPTEYET